MIGGGHGLECHATQPCGFAHVTRSDVCAFLYRHAAPGVATSNDQVGLTSRTRGNGDGASDPSRVAGAAERAATGDARDVTSFDATSFAIARKALRESAGRRRTAFGHGQAVATVASELAIIFRRALRISTGRPAGSARTCASGASSRGAAGSWAASGCSAARAGSRSTAGPRDASGSCGAPSPRAASGSAAWAVEVLGHAGRLARAIVAIGLPIAATNGLIELGTNLRLGRTGSGEVAATFSRRRFAELTGRARKSRQSAADLAGTTGAASAAGSRGASRSRGTAGAARCRGAAGSRGAASSRGAACSRHAAG